MNLSRRTFLASTALMALARPELPVARASGADAPVRFSRGDLVFAASNDVGFGGFFGARYKQSLDRLSREPIDKVDFVLDDVNFNQKRRFYNYSGDISGRYLEIASLASTKDKPVTPIILQVIDEIVQYQNPDGHFGREVDWNKPIDVAGSTDQSLEMPILWGNGRLMLGLFAAYERFGNEKAFEAAKKMADFYVNIVVKRFCDPSRMDEYRQQAKGYAAAYVTCVFHGIEGLVRAYKLTGEQKYLDCARQMADFHEEFDTLPVGHSHGSISTHEALVLLYEETGERKYLDRVIKRWQEAIDRGFVFPAGGVCEQFYVSGKSDEGCSESDWLRLSLLLWRNTGETKYLDCAERTLWNEYQMNQWHTGGFGHRYMIPDDEGCYAWGERYAESWWCCSYHGALGYYEFKEYLAVAEKTGTDAVRICCNFPLDFTVPLDVDGKKFTVSSRQIEASEGEFVRTATRVAGDAGSKLSLAVRIPEWAQGVRIQCQGKEVEATVDGTLAVVDIIANREYEISWLAVPYLENRRFRKIDAKPELGQSISGCVLRYGPNVMAAKNNDVSKIPDLELKLDASGKIGADPALLTCAREMTDEERNGTHAFVFNVSFGK